MTPRPLPVDPGFTVDLRCPHGHLVRADLDLVRSFQHLTDPCPAAEAEREKYRQRLAEKQARKEESELHQLWVRWKFRRQLKRGYTIDGVDEE